MSTNQLLAKALSTSSEEEAIACLRMARKKGARIEESTSSGDYNGHDAKYWHDKAYIWYTQAKAKEQKPVQNGMSIEQQQHLYRLYRNEEATNDKLRETISQLQRENENLKTQKVPTWYVPVMSLQFIVIVLSLALNGVQSASSGIESTQGDKHELESVHR